MHKCVRCNRIASSLEEINAGCPCGSKVFVFNKNGDSGNRSAAEEAKAGEENAGAAPEVQQQVQAVAEAPVIMKQNGKAPSSYYARTSFTTDDVENIRVQSEGVFVLDLNTLLKSPVVLKDEEGVYYVKLPYDEKKAAKGKKAKK